jgi:amino-acid N-acetyltransferase
MKSYTVRKAQEQDIPAIHTLLEHYADQGIVLRRSREDILKNLGSFFVAENDDRRICGCSAIRDFGGNLLEVRSLVVDPEFQGRGIGGAIVRAIVRTVGEERRQHPWRIFTLTGRPEFFAKQGFRTVPREMFPEKIWSDCRNCPKNTCCDEIAMLQTDADQRADRV